MRQHCKGSGLIEFALGFSVLAVFFVGMVEVAYSVIVLNQLTSAVRSGARYASTIEFDDPAHTFVDRVQRFVAFGTADSATEQQSQAPGLRPQHVSVTWSRDPAGAPATITVSVRDYQLPFLFQNRMLEGRPKATVQFAGSWQPRGRVLH